MPDLRQPPPPRYRVVERGRQLVVIDTRTGAASGLPPGPGSSPRPIRLQSWLPTRVSFDGSAELVTRRCYDDKGPRAIRLDPGSAALLGRLGLGALVATFALILVVIANGWLLLPVVLLWNGGIRSRIRGAATRWLDMVERKAG